jgi:hypothetical protein
MLQKEIRETYFLKAGFAPKIHNMKHSYVVQHEHDNMHFKTAVL